MKKGGSAKGELVLAIFELGNCFRHAWGVGKDPVAAREYYETAANLGDADAQNEVAWCYVEGFGCKKDKVSILSIPSSFYASLVNLAKHSQNFQTKRRGACVIYLIYMEPLDSLKYRG